VIALPRGHRAVTLTVCLVASASTLLVGCSTSQQDAAATSTPVLLGSPSPTDSAPSGSPAAQPVDLGLPESWTTLAAAQDGAGYVLELESTGSPGVYDGRFYRRAADGAVSGQQPVTVTTKSPDDVRVRWPDGTDSAARLTLPGDAGARTELALDPGCLGFLLDGSSQLDCRLYPADEFGPTSPAPSASPADPSAAASAAPTPDAPVELPDADEALGYLCSVTDPTRIDHVTGADSDPYATAVLQQALVAVGEDPGPVDGSYSAQIRRAVRDFQRSAGLAVDGLVGPRTWTSLQTSVCTLPSDPAG
jgi:hypothetical protein